MRNNEAMLNELMSWLIGAEATLTALDSEALPNEIPPIEMLLKDHQVKYQIYYFNSFKPRTEQTTSFAHIFSDTKDWI
jgi:hypothetical protein